MGRLLRFLGRKLACLWRHDYQEVPWDYDRYCTRCKRPEGKGIAPW